MSTFDFLEATRVSWWVTCLIAFGAVFVSEVAWVLCVRWTAQGRVLRTALMSSFMVLVGWSGLIVILGNPAFAIPAEMTGAAAGVWAAMSYDRRLNTGTPSTGTSKS